MLKAILPNQVNDPFEWNFQENPNLLVTGDSKINKTSVLSKLVLSASSLENSLTESVSSSVSGGDVGVHPGEGLTLVLSASQHNLIP